MLPTSRNVDPDQPSRCTVGDYSHLHPDDRPWQGINTLLDTQLLWRRLSNERFLRQLAQYCTHKNQDFLSQQSDRFDHIAQFDR